MTTITFAIEGPPGKIPATALAGTLTESLKILKDLGRNDKTVWYVTDLKIGSAVAELTADDAPGEPGRVALQLVEGIQTTEEGDGLPAHFSDSNLNRLARITKRLESWSVPGIHVIARTNGHLREVTATENTATNLARFRTPRVRAIGSITGVLDTISLRGRKGFGKFQVADPLSRRPVTCDFPVSDREVVKTALGQRVTVRGIVVRNAKGQPIRVEDATFEILKPAPSLVSLVGIDPDFTGGLSTAEYMERICS